MKLTRLSTTSKLYLLTLLLIFGILLLNQNTPQLAAGMNGSHKNFPEDTLPALLQSSSFLNQSVFAQEQTKSTTSQKRLKLMERYLSWIETGEYGQYQREVGNKSLADFKSFLAHVLTKDKECLAVKNEQKPLLEEATSFFSNLLSGEQKSVSGENARKLSVCKAEIKTHYKLAKKYNRLLKYLQIEEGQPNVCVKADLGVGTALMARGFNPAKVDSDNPKETGISKKLRVYLCTGNDGKKKVRVVDDSGTRLRLAPEDASKPEFKVENLPPKGSFDTLLGKLNLK